MITTKLEAPLKQSKTDYQKLFNKEVQASEQKIHARRLLTKGWLPVIFFVNSTIIVGLNMLSSKLRESSGNWFYLPTQYLEIFIFTIDLCNMLVAYYENQRKVNLAKQLSKRTVTSTTESEPLINEVQGTNLIINKVQDSLGGAKKKSWITLMAATGSLSCIISGILVIFMSKHKEAPFPINQQSSLLAKINMGISLYGALVGLPFYIIAIWNAVKTCAWHVKLLFSKEDENGSAEVNGLIKKLKTIHTRCIEMIWRGTGFTIGFVALFQLCAWSLLALMNGFHEFKGNWPAHYANKLNHISIQFFFISALSAAAYGLAKGIYDILLWLIVRTKSYHLTENAAPDIVKLKSIAPWNINYFFFNAINVLSSKKTDDTMIKQKLSIISFLKQLKIEDSLIAYLREEDLSAKDKRCAVYLLSERLRDNIT